MNDNHRTEIASTMTGRRLLAIVPLIVLSTSLYGDTPASNLLAKPDAWFRSDEGRQAMENILSWQSTFGDWPKNKDTTGEPFTGDRSKLQGTFDNGATTGELRVLASAFRVTGDTRYEMAFLAGFDHILKAQYPNGGWPQYFPLRKGYYTHITFNDNCMIRLMEFLSETCASEEYAFLNKDPSARPLWARFYEIKSNRPFFCDRDGVVKYDIEEIGDERRGGYTWYGNWGESVANEYSRWPHR